MTDDLFSHALQAALLIGALLPIIGRQLILRRAVLLGLVIPQLAMTGIAFISLAHGLHWRWAAPLADESSQAILGALLFGVPGLLLIATPWRRRPQISDAWLAVIYLAAVAATNLILASDAVGETYLNDLFHGRLLFIDAPELRLLGLTLGLAFAVLWLLRRRFLVAATAPEFALVAGLSIAAWTTLGTVLSGLAIGVTVATAGPLVAFAFLVLPSLTAATCTRSLSANLTLSMLLGLATAWIGFRLSMRLDTPLGDTVVASGCALLLFATLMKPFWRRL